MIFGYAPSAAIGVVIRRDGEIELAVFEHLSPDTAVNTSAEVLDKLAVDILRDWLCGLVRINLNRRLCRLGFGNTFLKTCCQANPKYYYNYLFYPHDMLLSIRADRLPSPYSYQELR